MGGSPVGFAAVGDPHFLAVDDPPKQNQHKTQQHPGFKTHHLSPFFTAVVLAPLTSLPGEQ
jgi:hypothetical protein